MDNKSAGSQDVSSPGNNNGVNPEKIVYSSEDILSNSVAGKGKKFFTRIKRSRHGLAGKDSADKDTARARGFLRNKKAIALLCGGIILLAVATIALLWVLVWRHDGSQLNPPTTNDESKTAEKQEQDTISDQWEEEIKLLNSEAKSILSKNSDDAIDKVKELYEYELENYYQDISAKRVDLLRNYASTLFYADYPSDAMAILMLLDIEAYSKPEDVSEIDYTHQKLSYYGLLHAVASELGMTEEASKYDQKIIELTNEEDKLAGEKEGVENESN